ncbi:MAG: hypothetical protein AVDCRST_MAG53-162 [uncultured Solirubrobacteraceae bacterium]|uniref:Uncharacterized protein n=1 Tax=uncultured Solirubrobacteraceae bacterium TaxID=1162706 RepID=A0A6J4RII7_9ACTN|nr:MAG: hypothetical protein AVDCRST_MAG53-162 [uncultured Solirubrobacteraceae bacterium]
MFGETPEPSPASQPVTDDSIQVRHLNHYQFTWVAAGEPGAPGMSPCSWCSTRARGKWS